MADPTPEERAERIRNLCENSIYYQEAEFIISEIEAAVAAERERCLFWIAKSQTRVDYTLGLAWDDIKKGCPAIREGEGDGG